MGAPSSPSLPPRNPANARAPPREKHLRTPPSTVQGRRTEIAPIDDPAKRRVAFWKRRAGLFSKASALCEHTGARAAVIVFSSTGKLYSSPDLSVEETAEIIFDHVHCNGGAMPPMGPKEGAGRVKKEGKCFSNRFKTLSKKASELCTKTDARAAVIVFSNTGSLYACGFPTVEDAISDWLGNQRQSCVTNEDFDSLNLKYEPVLHYVMREKLKDCGIDPDLPKDGNSSLILPKDSAVGNGSLGEELAHSDDERYENNENDIFAGLADITSV